MATIETIEIPTSDVLVESVGPFVTVCPSPSFVWSRALLERGAHFGCRRAGHHASTNAHGSAGGSSVRLFRKL